MASGITQFAGNLLLNRILRGTAGTFPATVFIGLGTGTSGTGFTDTTQTLEITSGTVGGYARQPIVIGTTFTASTVASSSNVNVIDFGTASSGAGVSVTQWGMFDAITTGNLLFWADLTTAQTVSNGNPYSFAGGALAVAMI